MRITIKDIQNRLNHLNDLMGYEREPYGPRLPNNIANPNAGCYHTSQAYGGIRIEQMSLNVGCTGVRNVTGGYDTKRECYEKLNAFIDGVIAAQDKA